MTYESYSQTHLLPWASYPPSPLLCTKALQSSWIPCQLLAALLEISHDLSFLSTTPSMSLANTLLCLSLPVHTIEACILAIWIKGNLQPTKSYEVPRNRAEESEICSDRGKASDSIHWWVSKLVWSHPRLNASYRSIRSKEIQSLGSSKIKLLHMSRIILQVNN